MRKKVQLLLFLVMPFVLFAQKQIVVTEGSYAMSKGTNSGYQTEIPQSNLREAQRDWRKLIGASGKGRISEVNDEIIAKGMENKIISPQPFNVYAKLISTKEGVGLTAWFTSNDSVFFSTAEAKRMVRDFAAAEYFLAVRDELKNEREKLEKQKDDLEKFIRQEEKANMHIADSKRAIDRAKEDLQTNEGDQKELAGQISLQQAELNKARSANGDAYKGADKAMRDLDDNMKKLKAKNEDLHRRIDEWNKDITGEQRNVTSSTEGQKQSSEAIAKQRQLLKDIEAKMKGIK